MSFSGKGLTPPPRQEFLATPLNPFSMWQVGDGDQDHAYWGRPEDMTMARPAWSLTTGRPGSDLAGEVAAAFAAGYLLFRDSGKRRFAKYSSTPQIVIVAI